MSPSERVVLDAVRRLGPIARSSLPMHCNLAQQSVHRIADELIKQGFIEVREAERGRRGQPSPRLALSVGERFSVGLAVNTDCAIVCLANMQCEVIDEVRLRTSPADMMRTLADARAALERMLARNHVSHAQVLGLGVGMTGFFAPTPGQVNAPEPLRSWSLVDLFSPLREAFELPVRIQNNATTAAVGELLNGVGRQAKSFVYLSFNHGLGGGIVINGQVLLGAHGNAGEVGLCLTPDEAEDRPALGTLMAELRRHSVAVDSIEDLRQRFNMDWPGVSVWLERSTPQLQRIVNSVIAVIDPQAIVFGGQLPPVLGAALIKRVADGQYEPRYGVGPIRPEFVLSNPSVDASAAGAAALILKEAYFV